MSNIYPEDGSQAPGVLPETDIQPASTLKDQVGKVRQRVRGEAANFASSAREKAAGAIEERQHKVTGAIGDFAHAIRRASDDLNEHNQGMAAQLLTRGADSLEGLSHTLDGKSPGEMLDAVRDFGRRHPVAFIGGAVLVGLAVGRLVRSSASDDYDDTYNYETGRGWEEPMGGATADGLDANAASFDADAADATLTPEGAGASPLDESGLSAGVDTGALDQGVGESTGRPGSTTRGV